MDDSKALFLMKYTCKMTFFAIGLILAMGLSIDAIQPALILTPFIKTNHLDLARNASSVDPSFFLNVKSYSGFLTVDERYNSNIYFWYFPVVGKPITKTPWILWLQGGPGASSIAGLFGEIGPFQYNGKLNMRESSWTKSHSVLFIDNPVGAGFSFTNSRDGFIQDMPTCATHLYKVLQQFLKMFPELRKAPLYLAGESYAGRYLPALALKILDQDDTLGALDLNLQGIMMGNPVLTRHVISDYGSIFQQWGLIDSQGAQAVKPLQDSLFQAIRNNDSAAADNLRNKLLIRLDEMTMQSQNFNLLADDLQTQLQAFIAYVTSPLVKQALHAGDIVFTFSNKTVHEKLYPDFLSEVTSKMERLLEHYRILIYCGQLDLTAPCVPNAQDRRKSWHWSQRDAFLTAPRTPWWNNNSVAGYVKSGGRLTEVLVRGAGHLVPMDKPDQLLELISYFIRGLDMPLPPNYQVLSKDTPEYITPVEETAKLVKTLEPEASSSGIKTTMIVSILINVILIVGILSGLVYSLRWRHRVQMFSYNNVEETSITAGVLNMS